MKQLAIDREVDDREETSEAVIYACAGSFNGRPPFLPFLRAASALAWDVTLPPLRPSATAAGFLRGTLASQAHRARVVSVVLRIPHFRVRAVARAVRAEIQAIHAGFPCGQRLTTAAFLGDLVGRKPCRHEQIIPNRLGSVNPAEIGRKWAV